MSNLKNAPLIYTLAMIQFPRIPDIERFIDKFMESIRKDYPLDDRSSSQAVNANISSEGITIEPQQEAKFWQYTSIDKKWSFIISDQALFLHTSDYHDFEDFSKRFRKGIIALRKIPNIDIKWMKSIGIRYVNLIPASGKTSLSDYLHMGILPFKPPGTSLKVTQGIYATRYKTENGELRLQALYNPSFTLPPDLNSPFIIKNGWVKDRPATEFALIDIDHGSTWEKALKFDENCALDALSNFRKISRKVFDSIATKKAMTMWEA